MLHTEFHIPFKESDWGIRLEAGPYACVYGVTVNQKTVCFGNETHPVVRRCGILLVFLN
jgi:hypothetical protein